MLRVAAPGQGSVAVSPAPRRAEARGQRGRLAREANFRDGALIRGLIGQMEDAGAAIR
jgi:hypothetical protein